MMMRSGRRTLPDVVDWLFHLCGFGVDHCDGRCLSTIYAYVLQWKVVPGGRYVRWTVMGFMSCLEVMV
jgi:hypothetical protein